MPSRQDHRLPSDSISRAALVPSFLMAGEPGIKLEIKDAAIRLSAG